MRWGLVGGVFLGALVIAVGAAEPAGVALPSRSQLKLMPLPQASYGAKASSLSLDSDSGRVSNKESAEDELDPTLTAAALTRMGRITGFDVEFDDLTKASQRGLLVDADSEVDLFRTEAGAARYIAREAGEFRRLEGKRLQYGIVVDQVSYFAATGLRAARGVHFRVRAGGLTFWATGVLFQVGTLLAGNVHDNPIGTTTPKLGGLGPPAGGPDLASMAIAPADFDGSARPTHQGYVRNTDDIADYVREFRSVTFGSSALAWLKSEVELRPSAKAANDFVSLLRSLLHGPRGRTFMQEAITSGFSPSDRKEVRIGRVSQLKVREGDASVALSTSFTTRGLSFQFVLTIVQRDRVVETLGAVSPPRGAIRLVDTRRLARTDEAEIRRAGDRESHPRPTKTDPPRERLFVSTTRRERDVPRRRSDRESRHRRAARLPRDVGRDEGRARRLRDDRAAGRLRRRSAPASVPDRALRGARGNARHAPRQGEGRATRRRDRRGQARDAAQVLERGRRRGALRVHRDAGAPVRAADRDDVLARGGREDEPQGHAEPAPARRDREPPLRRRAPAAHPAVAAEAGARARRAGRPDPRLRPDLRPGAGRARTVGRVMKRAVFIGVVVTAALVLAVGGWIVDGARSILKP